MLLPDSKIYIIRVPGGCKDEEVDALVSVHAITGLT